MGPTIGHRPDSVEMLLVQETGRAVPNPTREIEYSLSINVIRPLIMWHRRTTVEIRPRRTVPHPILVKAV